MNKTGIAWTDYTWNASTGCTKVSEGCKFCYAEAVTKRFFKDKDFKDVTEHKERLKQPLGVKGPAKIFVNSMSDLFHEDLSRDFVTEVLDIMTQSANKKPDVIFQVLTKRPGRMKMLLDMHDIYINMLGYPLWEKMSNLWKVLWVGVTAENQKTADERIPILLETPGKVKFISAEPLLGPLDIRAYKGLDWVICGAESGPHARPMDTRWAYELKDQCKEMGVAFFMKQICEKGKPIPYENFPKDLQIREYPE